MFYGQRVVDIADSKPKWSGINGDSERLDEDSSGADNENGEGNGMKRKASSNGTTKSNKASKS